MLEQEPIFLNKMPELPPKVQQRIDMIRYAVIICFMMLCSIQAFSCQYCEDDYIELQAKSSIWGDTWICRNPRCQYENLVGVYICPLCGTEKSRR